jgi:protein-disulfide isomerase
MTKEVKILLGVGVVILAGGIALFASQPKPLDPSQPIDSTALVREGSRMTGAKDAKVTVVEFGDFQCPACATAAPIVKQVLAVYQSNPQFNFVFRNFPLPQHDNAEIAAEAAEAAGEQGKYWEMYDLLYQRQAQWQGESDPLNTFAGYATELGLNADSFRQSVADRKYSAVIDADSDDGDKAGVSGTPTFFLNGEKLDGIPSFEEFKQKIDEALVK